MKKGLSPLYVRTLHWDHTVAKDIIATLNACQLASGFETPLLEGTSIPITYLGTGWILNLRMMLDYYGMQVWVEDIWRFKKQRRGDRSIMKTFASDPLISKMDLVLVSELCKWLRVVFISEIASIDGTSIPYERIRNGSEWRATPLEGFNWPNAMTPTNEHRAAFRKCLRLTFCPHMGPWARQDYKLLHDLGMWYPVQRHIEFDCYRTPNSILYCDETGLHECIDVNGTGFFSIPDEDYTGDIPLESYPIVPTKSAPDVLWTRRPFRCAPVFEPTQAIQVLRSDMSDICHMSMWIL